MKWTKFKDEKPKKWAIFITDWERTWISPILTTMEAEMLTKLNPEFAWAEISLPDVPKNPKQEHLKEFLDELLGVIKGNYKILNNDNKFRDTIFYFKYINELKQVRDLINSFDFSKYENLH